MSDRIRSAPDVAFKPAGTGMAGTFLCGACANFRSIYGRRLKRVMGLRQYVCAACAKP